MKKEIYKGVTIEYTKVVRTVFGITKVFAYDLKLTTNLDKVNNMSRRIVTAVQPYEPVFWQDNGDGTATIAMYSVGEYSMKHIRDQILTWYND